MLPGAREAEALALQRLPPHGRLVRLDREPLAPCDVVLATQPRPLLSTLAAIHEALSPGGALVVRDVVWATAPTPELARALAPALGPPQAPASAQAPPEKVRPIEGYEMQLDHAGFDVVQRIDIGRAEWLAVLPEGPLRAALAADERGAARVCVWVATPSTDAPQA